ncbi:MAG: hypothetical protein IJ272_02410 [Clostridia bacterium]|nr:hypothetical protein [Clostridia bacterium]
MIFVTVGTQDKPFERIIKAVEDAVLAGKITDEVIVQAGNTKYESKVLNVLNYVPFDEFNNYIEKADIIITHGGVGSILNALKLKKKIIAVPRLKKYGEHINDHQLQVIQKMTEDGYILSCEDENEIADKVREAENFVVKEYTSNTDNFIANFKEVLDDTLNGK